MPEISLIIPFKNTEKYLEDCLKSIQKQDFEDFEVILVNDHSADASLGIIHANIEKDPRFKIFQNNGHGIIPALQTGYANSTGHYITRMDSDDMMTSQKLSTMLRQLKENGQGFLAVGLVKYFSSVPLGEGFQKYETWLNGLSEKGDNFSDIYKECVIPSPCWMVHRADFDRVGGFNSTLYPEDYDLAFRFYKHGLKVIPSSKVLHHWRDYSTRTSRTHPHYSDNGFLDIKTTYFLELAYKPEKKLILWGAGKKGKKIAQLLIERKIVFKWVCDNPNKEGRDIYGVILENYKNLALNKEQQHIISIASVSAKELLSNLFKRKDLQHYYFC